jgi:methionyl-tRNA synthetase
VVSWTDVDKVVRATAEELSETVPPLMEALDYATALEEIWTLVRAGNRYVEETKPFIIAKDPSQRDRLGVVLYNLAETCRILSLWISPFMPGVAAKIREQFALGALGSDIAADSTWGKTVPGTAIRKGEPLFPRLDLPGQKRA